MRLRDTIGITCVILATFVKWFLLPGFWGFVVQVSVIIIWAAVWMLQSKMEKKSEEGK